MNRIASTRHTIILLLILAAVAAAGYVANVKHGAGGNVNRLGFYATVVIAQLLLVRYVVAGLRVPLREIVGGFRWYDAIIAAALFFAIRFTSIAIHHAFGGIDSHTAFLVPRGVAEIVIWIVVSIVAGACEEIVFRGYLQPQLPIGVVAQAIVFGVSHGYQGVRSIINITAIGLLFGVVAKWRKSLVPGMLAHAATDIAGIF
jgi:membrane protease YdiL (CAAX protease family)